MGQDRFDEGWIEHSVGIQHDHDIAGDLRQACIEGCGFADGAQLSHCDGKAGIGKGAAAGYVDCEVGAAVLHDDDLLDATTHLIERVDGLRKGRLLVVRGDQD